MSTVAPFPTPQPTVLDDSYPATVTIDGCDVKLRVKRFTLDEFTKWQADFNKIGRYQRKGELFIEKYRRPLTNEDGTKLREPADVPNPDAGKPMLDANGEPVQDEHGEPRIEPPTLPNPRAGQIMFEDDRTTLARLELDAPDVLDAFEKQAAKEEEFSLAFMRDAFAKFITVEACPFVLPGGREYVRTGEQLLDRFAARSEVLQAVMQQIQIENVLSDAQKKELRSRLASKRSSSESNRPGNGGAPATTVAAASTNDSSSSAAATQ